MTYTDEAWSMAFLADRRERDRLVAEREARLGKLALPITPARKRVRPLHVAAVERLRQQIVIEDARLAMRNLILRDAGMATPEDMDDMTATNAIALLRWQAGRG